jgi:hypothetical protein
MNRADMITISKNEDKNFKISKSEYFDISMAIVNSVLIILLFTIARNNTIVSILFTSLFIGILFGGTIFLFFKKNPFYIYFCYGITLCGIIGNVFGVILNPFLAILFFLQFLYMYGKIADLFTTIEPSYSNFFGRIQEQKLVENKSQEIMEKRRREIEKEFNGNLIALISLCCSIGLFLTLIFSA